MSGKGDSLHTRGAVAGTHQRAMVRIDMSEFMEKHSVARLIGAQPATSATKRAAGEPRPSAAHRTPCREDLVAGVRAREQTPPRADPAADRRAGRTQRLNEPVLSRLRLLEHRQHLGEPALLGLRARQSGSRPGEERGRMRGLANSLLKNVGHVSNVPDFFEE